MNAYLKAMFVGIFVLVGLELWAFLAHDVWLGVARDVFKSLPIGAKRWVFVNLSQDVFIHFLTVFYALLSFATISFFIACAPKDNPIKQ